MVSLLPALYFVVEGVDGVCGLDGVDGRFFVVEVVVLCCCGVCGTYRRVSLEEWDEFVFKASGTGLGMSSKGCFLSFVDTSLGLLNGTDTSFYL